LKQVHPLRRSFLAECAYAWGSPAACRRACVGDGDGRSGRAAGDRIAAGTPAPAWLPRWPAAPLRAWRRLWTPPTATLRRGCAHAGRAWQILYGQKSRTTQAVGGPMLPRAHCVLAAACCAAPCLAARSAAVGRGTRCASVPHAPCTSARSRILVRAPAHDSASVDPTLQRLEVTLGAAGRAAGAR
jgi:hypothetical protein